MEPAGVYFPGSGIRRPLCGISGYGWLYVFQGMETSPHHGQRNGERELSGESWNIRHERRFSVCSGGEKGE